MKTIELIVAPDGSSRVETKGFAGSECQSASRFLEQALGQVQQERQTAEFYRQRAGQTLSQSQQAGQ